MIITDLVNEFPVVQEEASLPVFYKSGDAVPFLKWAGGKREFIKNNFSLFPNVFNQYHEPFLGGGAVLFYLKPQVAYCNDYNSELVATYNALKNDFKGVLTALLSLTVRHSREFYYAVRECDRDERWGFTPPAYIAARMIYLNRTCFNGLYRVNSKGFFNSPLGKTSTGHPPTIINAQNLYNVHTQIQQYVFTQGDYMNTLEKVKEDDFVFLDPPYEPLTKTSNFTSYTKNRFTYENQKQVFTYFQEANRKGAKVMLTNSSNPKIVELYKNFNLIYTPVKRSISSNSHTRKPVQEIIVTNY